MNRKYLPYLLLALAWYNGGAQNYPPYRITSNAKASTGYYFIFPIKRDPDVRRVASFNLVLDSNGMVVLYKKFSGGTYTGDFKINYDKRMSYNYQDKYYIMDSTFEVIDSAF